MRRIVFVTSTNYLPGMITGENVSVHSRCRRLMADGFDPLVVCGLDSSSAAPPSRLLDYTVLRLREPVAAMLEIMDRLAPDAVVVSGAQTAATAAAMASARARRLHILLTAVSYRFAAPPRRETPGWRYAANSRFLIDFARAFLGVPAAFVPTLIEPEDYRCRPAGDAVLFVNPVAAKGVHLVAAIAQRLPHRRFLVVQSWPDHAAFPHFRPALPNIDWRASVPDMRTLYAETKLVLMPTIVEESSGRTAQEAQISGIPVIASDRGGLRDSVAQGGIVLPLDEPVERWCAEIEALFTDPRRYAALSEAAREHATRPEAAPAAVMARFMAFLGS